ncbi:uncharacterized protein LOC128285414 [Gossypium arboreum]|uniref:uncharacterized protein LOC128285414 n=1 Tax=Gossypium arboreum TaxID=29729 RepID=UPI0022F1D4D3|nr:uncharacterized protein LOC128285414 [Gossypium arboreum]
MMEKEVVLNQTHSRHPLLWLIIIFQFSLLFFSAFSAEITARKILKDKSKKSPKVRLEKTDEKVIINNGIVEVTIEKPTGHLLGIKYNGIDNVLETKNDNDNRGYWDIVWDHDMYDK